jgi:ribosomal protein S18 acetylase RimI-like enzyme
MIETPPGETLIRTARPADADAVCPMLIASEPETYDYVYRDDGPGPEAFVRYEFLSGRGFGGWHNVTVAERAGTVVGVGCLYAGSAGGVLQPYGRLLRGSLFNMLRVYRLSVWRYMARAQHLGSIMRAPSGREAYLSAFLVDSRMRGQGIGTAMLRHWVTQARRHGCDALWLDISETNTHAEALYLSLGFELVGTRPFSGHREGFPVQGTKQMVLRLTGRTLLDAGAPTSEPQAGRA